MKKDSPAKYGIEENAVQSKLRRKAVRNLSTRQLRTVRIFSFGLLVVGAALLTSVSPFAQKRNEGRYKVTGVTSRKTSDSTVVTLSADAPLNRTQTWEDEEGFHMSLPGASPAGLKGLPRGVIVRNLGKTLEVVVAVKPGTAITVDPQFNRLNLIIKGDVAAQQSEAQLGRLPNASRAQERSEESVGHAQSVRQHRERRPLAEPAYAETPSSGRKDFPTSSPITSSAPAPGDVNAPFANARDHAASNSASTIASSMQPVSGTDAGVRPAGFGRQERPQPKASTDQPNGGVFDFLSSTIGLVLILLFSLIALVVVRKRRRTRGYIRYREEKHVPGATEAAVVALNEPKKERRRSARRQSDQSLVKTGSRQEGDPGVEGAMEKRLVVPMHPALFGAYRVDQEVGKLVLGQAHRLDVLSSRSPDDRRALETSLLKAINSRESGEEGRRRARLALEEYGFVARQCASLLLAHTAYDRASAARALGEIGSQSSLPFLLEALYDNDMIVRTEAVACLGTLKMPSAIGALLDMARRHPEMPTAIISSALSACSVECFDFFNTPAQDRLLLDTGDGDSINGEITHLDSSEAVDALPEWFESEELAEALTVLEHGDVEARAAAARRLAQFPAKCSVEALTVLAAYDPKSMVRSTAVTSLGEIAHESVFAPVLMAFADDSREVRAAAARSLSRMTFDRSEGYVRLIETEDIEKLRKVAKACIKAGIVEQAIDRMISEDRRLAYEAFSLLSLLVKANETEPMLEAINSHPESGIRLALIRILGTSGQSEVATQFRHLAVREGMPENVRAALMEVVYKIDQTQQV